MPCFKSNMVHVPPCPPQAVAHPKGAEPRGRALHADTADGQGAVPQEGSAQLPPLPQDWGEGVGHVGMAPTLCQLVMGMRPIGDTF